MNSVFTIVFLAAFLAVPIVIFGSVFALLIRPWMQVFLAGGRVPLSTVLAMRLRGLPVSTICNSYIMIVQCGADVDINRVQKAHLMGADVDKLARAVCLAKQSDEPFVWDDLVATAIAENSRI